VPAPGFEGETIAAMGLQGQGDNEDRGETGAGTDRGIILRFFGGTE